MNVKSFKLVTGEEIIARVEEDLENRVVLLKPRVIRVIQARGGEVGIAMLPWVVSGGDENPVTLFAASIITIVTPTREVEQTYLSETSAIALDAGRSMLSE